MSKSRLLILACAALAVVMSVIVSAAPQDDAVRIASLVNDMKSMDFTQLKSLQPVTVKPHTLPGPSVDVMRVQLEETYAVEGIGKDTVELNGWIAVRHGASRPAPGETLVSWETAVTDTEFVGMELRGQSSIFGPVKVTLDSSRPAIGQVGSQVSIPEQANQIISSTSPDASPVWWPGDLFGDFRLHTLREIVLHVMTETACHAGHVDAVRELIDGRAWLILTE